MKKLRLSTLMPTSVAALTAFFLSLSSVTAANTVIKYIPYGPSASGVNPYESNYCFTVPYSWEHELAYSTWAFTSTLWMEYLDWYSGSTTLDPASIMPSFKFGTSYFVDSHSPGTHTDLVYATLNQRFDSYDITTYSFGDNTVPYSANKWAYVYSPFGYMQDFQISSSCIASSTVLFRPT